MDDEKSALFPEHLADLRKSGLSTQMIDTMGVYSLSIGDFEKATGTRFPGVESYLAFPYPGVNGYVRYKLFPPFKDEDGKELKYYQPAGSGCHLYLVPHVREILSDSSQPLYITEGEKKAALLVQVGKMAIGLGGIWNWRIKETHQPISDLNEITWKDRLVYLLPDSDAWQKDEVLLAVYTLGRELEKQGAILQIIRLPILPDLEKTGIDDYLVAKGIKAFQNRCNKTILLSHPSFRSFHLREKKQAREETKRNAAQEKEHQQTEAEARNQALLSTPADLYQIHAELEELSSASHDLIELVTATAISLPVTQSSHDALVWLLVVGNPSSDKTNQASLVREMPNIYFLDTLTENSFITGYVPDSGVAPKDLLAELDNRCLVVKELGAIFSLKAEVIRKLLGDLQAIYDGRFAKYTGTRGLVEHKAAFSFIGCITPLALNQHQRYMSAIGPRFLFYRVPPLTQQQVIEGFELSWQQEKRRERMERLRQLVSAYAWQRYQANTPLVRETPEQQARLNELATFLSYGRAVVLTERREAQGDDGKSFTVYENTGFQREEPFRALQQLRGLARSLAILHKRDHITDHELELLRRVVLSSMPPERADTLRLFQEGSPHLRPDGGLTRRETEKGIERSYNQAKRQLQELETLGLLESAKESVSGEWVYRPAERFKQLITAPLTPIDHLLDLETDCQELPPESLVNNENEKLNVEQNG